MLPSFVHVSLSISELHEQAYSHCSLLWCEKGVYQQVIGVISLNLTCLPSFIHPSIQVRELHKHACPIVMYILYGPKLLIVVFQKVRCLQKPLYAYSLHTTKLYISTKFHIMGVLQNS